MLVHGLWWSAWSMAVLEARLRRRGFRTHRFAYPSTRWELEHAASKLQSYCARLEGPVIHFVGHSLGGLVICALFHFHSVRAAGRIVTLGTPHCGSDVATALARTKFGRTLLGPGLVALVQGVPQRWSAPRAEVGVIAGARGLGLGRLVAPGLARPNDGTVAVAETHLPGARAHRVLSVSHLGMLLSRDVAEATARFLRSGRFDASGVAPGWERPGGDGKLHAADG